MIKTMPALTPQILFETFINFDVHYSGLIPEIPADMDPTGRTDILKVIDHGKKCGRIPWHVGSDQEAVLGINAYSIRILAKASEEVLLTVPVHMLAAVCFVKDDSRNIIGIKIGEVGNNREISDLAVVNCATEKQSTDICHLMDQCFQLVFSEATQQCFHKKITEGAAASMRLMDTAGSVSSADQTYGTYEGPSFISGSRTDLNRIQPSRPPHRSSTTHSESDHLSAYAADLIQDYMRMLLVLLTTDEVKQFAILLKRWRGADSLPFAEFCQKVLELYGPERKHLLARMRPFIPEKDFSYFLNFMEQSGVTDNAECSLPSCSPGSEFDISEPFESGISSTVKVVPELATAGATGGAPQSSGAAAPIWSGGAIGRRTRSMSSDTGTTIVINEVEMASKQLGSVTLEPSASGVSEDSL